MEPSERDWKPYKGRVSGWQEHYMERLTEDYVTYLNGDESAPTEFWTMEKRMKQDKKIPGACIELSRRNMIFNLVHFLQDEVIMSDDPDEFSGELRKNVGLLKERFGRLKCRRTDHYEWRCEYRYVCMKGCN